MKKKPPKQKKLPAATESKDEQQQVYRQDCQTAIKKRRRDMPGIYRANYDKAMSGKSKAAALKSMCLECMSWAKEEVRLCTSPACPLFPYRPYKQAPKTPNNSGYSSVEATNTSEGV